MVTTSKAALGQHFGDLGGYHRKYHGDSTTSTAL
jgi:hypothetical protein